MDREMLFWLLLTLAWPFGVVFGIIYLLRIIRTKGMKSLAETIGFSYAEEGDVSFASKLSKFGLFSEGYAKKIRSVLKGEKSNFLVSAFYYSYRDVRGSAFNRSPNVSWNKSTVIFFESAKFSFPDFSLRPKEFVELEKFNVINVVSNKIFNKRYLLCGSDENAVRNLFNPDVLTFFEQEKDWYAEGVDNKLILYKQKYLKPEHLRGFLEKTCQAAKILISSCEQDWSR